MPKINGPETQIYDAIDRADTSYRAALVVHKTKHIYSAGEWNKDSVDAVRAFYDTLIECLLHLELKPSEASAAASAAKNRLSTLLLTPEKELLPNNHD